MIFNNQKYLFKKNLENDIIGIYDSNNTLVCRYAYDVWEQGADVYGGVQGENYESDAYENYLEYHNKILRERFKWMFNYA